MNPYEGDPFIRAHWRALLLALVMFIVFLKGVPMELVIFLIIAATLVYMDWRWDHKPRG